MLKRLHAILQNHRGGISWVRGGISWVKGGKNRSWFWYTVNFTGSIVEKGHLTYANNLRNVCPSHFLLNRTFVSMQQYSHGPHRMPREFESRVFSSETLLAGMDLVQNGHDSLEHLDEAGLEEELRKLEEG